MEIGNVDHQNIDNETRLLSYDYIDYRLSQCGFEWPNRPRDLLAADRPTNSMLAIRSICDRYQERYVETFGNDEEIMNSLSIDDLSRTFSDVGDSVFRRDDGQETEITWGRIFSLFAFGGLLAVECARKQRPERIEAVADCLTNYAQTNLSDWIASKGGWEACVRIYENRKVETTSLLTKKAISGLFCGALGVVALAAVIVNRQ